MTDLTITLTEAELTAVQQLSRLQELTPNQVLVQGLRLYQSVVLEHAIVTDASPLFKASGEAVKTVRPPRTVSQLAVDRTEAVLRSARICDMSLEEWCDYWRTGDNSYLNDKLEMQDARTDLAEASALFVKLICAIRGWDHNVVKDLTFSEVHDSIEQHQDAMIQAMRQ